MLRYRILRAGICSFALALLALGLLATPLVLEGGGASDWTEAYEAGARRVRALWPEPTAEVLVRRALARVEEAGSFRLVTDAEQRLLPRGLARLAGASEERVDLRLEGEVAGPERARIELAVEGGVQPGGRRGVVTLHRQQGVTYIDADGRLEAIEDPAGLAVPGGEPLAFLAAGRDFRYADDGATADVSDPGGERPETPGLRAVAFTLDGPAFAARVRDAQERSLGADLPPGVRLEPPVLLAGMRGEGQVWIDERGLPLRLEMDLALDELDEEHDLRTRLVTQLSGFGEELAIPSVALDEAGRPGLVPADISKGPAAGLLWDRLAQPFAALLSVALALALAGGLLGARRAGRRGRRLYAAVVGATILSLVGGPGLQAFRMAGLSAAIAEAAERPSLASALGAERSAAEEELFAPRAPAQTSVPPEQIRRCGEGSAQRDTDGEGLSDYVESCLGTNPIEVDSDRDQLNDRLEIDGLRDPESGKLWTSDPLRADSNNDGLFDGEEWPAPHGSAPALDADGDGLANVWDPDNDGDGVTDGNDISPYSYTAFESSLALRSFRPTAGITDAEATQIVFVHVQPEDEAHLRYSLTPLDWAYDDLGQIQVLGQEAREIQLAPMLAIDTTISPTLSSQFGVSVQESPEGSAYPYQLLLPLAPVGDGGRIETLSGFLGYTPEELDELEWDARLVWTFTGTIDTPSSCGDGSASCYGFDSQQSTIAIYEEESFRVTGLAVQLSGETKIAAISAPESPDEDFPIMQALWGLNGSFLKTALPDEDPRAPGYDTIESALASITSNDPARNFGITSTLSSATPEVRDYANSVDAWQRFGGDLEAYLNGAYERCVEQAAGCVPDDPMVLYLSETLSGALSLDELAAAQRQEGEAYAPELAALPDVDVDTISLSVLRSTRWQTYEWRANEWVALSLDEMSALQEARYPDMDPGGVALMRLSYAAWNNGLNRPVVVDGVPVDTSDPYDYDDLADQMREEAFKGRSIGRYFARTYQQIAGPSPTGPAPTYASELGKILYDSFGAVQTLFNIAAVTLVIIELADPDLDLDPYIQGTTGVAATFSLLKKAAKYGAKVYDRYQAYKAVQEPAEDASMVELQEFKADWAVGDEPGPVGSEVSEDVSEAGAVAEDVSSATEWIPLIGLIVGVIVAVTVYLLTISQDWDNSILEGYAAADLIASIILLVIFYLLALIPVVGAIILAVIAIVEALVYLITWLVTGKGFDILGYVVQVIADFFFQAAQVTQIGDIGFGEVSTALLDEPLGPVVGNTYRVWTDLTARVEAERATVTTYIFGIPVHTHYTGTTDEVNRSHAFGSWSGLSRDGSPGDARVAPSAIPSAERPAGWTDRVCAYRDDANVCVGTVGQDFELLGAGTNVLLKLLTQVDFKLAFKEVIIAGAIPIQTIYQSGTSPERDSSDYDDAWNESALEFYLDVLPPSLDELWTWSSEDARWANHDRDADGLRNEEELDAPAPGAGTDWLRWDTDGDGLSDGFEIQGRRAISDTITGPDPSLADTDGDGLDDGFELFVSQTSVNDADTDGDGLADDEEICADGAAAWTVQVLTKTARVCANPNDPDPDHDGLTDLQEKAAGTSPFAWNQKAPTLRLEAEPRLHGPGGQWGTYLRPGQESAITVTLHNVVANEAEGEFQLCVGTGLEGLQAIQHPADAEGGPGCDAPGDQALDYALPPEQGAELQSVYSADAAQGGSRTVELRASLPYENGSLDPPVPLGTISQSLRVTIDGAAPDPRISAPAPSSGVEAGLPPALRGERYVLGGSASDADSWIERVDVRLRRAGDVRASWAYTTPSQTARWSAAWDLPEDGAYEIAVTARDAVGNESAELTRDVLVDNTPPSVSLDVADGDFLDVAAVAADGSVTATFGLRASDALAGLDVVQLSLDGRPFQRVALTGSEPYPAAVAQDFAWRLPASAQGEHVVALRAYDRAGNLSAESRARLVLDLTAPLSLRADAGAGVRADAALELRGHADETAALPLAPHPRALEGTLDALDDATVWQDLRGREGGATARWLGDANGDGRADLALGLPAYDADGDGSPEGRVVVAFGKAGGWQVPPSAEIVDEGATVYIGQAGAGIGAEIAPAGDVDGDGLADMLVGDPANDRAFLLFGTGGPLAGVQTLDGESATRTVLQGEAGAAVGRFISSAGDLDADGYADLLLVTTGAEGWAHVVPGGPGLRGRSVELAEASVLRLPMPPGGAPAVAAGDLDGDGYADYALADPTGALTGMGGQGSLRLVRGSRHLSATVPASVTLTGAAPFGELVTAAGDLNGDGYGDLAYASGAGAHLALGAADLAALDLRSLDVDRAELVSLAGVGDLDPSASDGPRPYDDLAIVTRDGGAAILFGASPFPADPVARATIAGAAEVAPAPFARASDVNCDGSADLLVLPGADAKSGGLVDAGPDGAERDAGRDVSLGAPDAAPRGLADRLRGVIGGLLPSREASAVVVPDVSSASSASSAAQSGVVAWVSPEYCAACDNDGRPWSVEAFATIGTALASGAAEVRVAPGDYDERVDLGADQALRGAGAEVVRLRMPASAPAGAPLVSVSGAGAGLSGLALLGRSADGAVQGAGIELAPGASLDAERILVRGTSLGASVAGAASRLRVDRATFVENDAGLRGRGCAGLELRNSILAYHGGAALDLALQGCASPLETAYLGFWANGQDVLRDGVAVDAAEIGGGQVPADPRFVAPSAGDYRLRAGSPMRDAGQPGDPVPPGAGPRVDLGYAEQGGAAAYAGADYCATCDNDGLRWEVDAFATIGEALRAARAARPPEGCAEGLAVGAGCGRPATVAVAPGVYAERLTLGSDVRLLGSGADATILDAGVAVGAVGSAVTIEDATRVELRGFSLRGFGTAPGSAGVRLVGAASAVTIAESLILGRFAETSGAAAGVALEDGASALVQRSTIADVSRGLLVSGAGSLAHLNSSLLSDYEVGVELRDGARAESAYNLYHSTVSGAVDTAFTGDALVGDGSDLLGVDPLLQGQGAAPYHVRAGSPALGAGDPLLPAPPGAGARVSIGYWDRLVTPATLLFGEAGARSCQDGHSGVAGVRLGLGQVEALSDTRAATTPSAWTEAQLEGAGGAGAAGRAWSAALPAPGAEGLYRLYARSRDAAGNESEQLLGELVADASPPLVELLQPASAVGDAGASLRLVGSVTDVVQAAGLPRWTVERAGFLVDEGLASERYLPGSWSEASWSVADGGARRFEADLAPEAGAHTVRAVARNEAGLETRSPAVSVEASRLDVATLVDPVQGDALRVRTVTLRGYARLADPSQRTIRAFVNGEQRAAGGVEGEGAVGPFELMLDLPEGDAFALQVVAGSGSLASAPSTSVSFDGEAPTLRLDSPLEGARASLSLRFEGQAEDESGRPPSVEVSLDGGVSWQAAATQDVDAGRRSFALDWVLPGDNDGRGYPLRVRARDAAGNETVVARRVVVDNVPPRGPEILSIAPAEGSSTSDPFSSVTLRWRNPVRDGAGPARVEAAVLRDAAGLPAESAWAEAMAGCSTQGTTWTCEHRATLSGTGAYTVFLRASDLVGNHNVTGYGPFYVGMAAPAEASVPEHAESRRTATPSDAPAPPERPASGALASGLTSSRPASPAIVEESQRAEEDALPAARLAQAPPSVSFRHPWSGSLPPGRQLLSGSASAGAGLVAVELRRLPDGAWKRARGTAAWSFEVDLPDEGRVRYEARALDRDGRASPVSTLEVVVDALPPTAELSAPGALSGSRVLLEGRAWDLGPAPGPIAAVQLRVDGGPWRPAALGRVVGSTRARAWRYLWTPRAETPRSYDIELRARDAAGNWSEPLPGGRIQHEAAREADLSVAIELDAQTPIAGRALRARARVENEGPATANEVLLVVGIPPETRLNSAPRTCLAEPHLLLCELGELGAGASRGLDVELLVVDDPRAHRLRLYAGVRSLGAARDPDPWNDRAEDFVDTGTALLAPLFLPFTHRHRR